MAQPANFNVVICANSSIVPLLNGGLIRPLDDLVAKYGSHLAPSQLVTVDGKIMAIAFMANAQHLMYRSDLLEAAGVAPPGTYEEVIAAAEAIRSAGLMQYPLSGTYKAGWNLGEEFVNLYVGLGGEFFEPGTAVAAIQNEKALAALDMMKRLTSYMHPDFLTFDLDLVAPQLLQNQIAMANLWGSRGGAILDPANAAEGVAGNIALAAAAAIGGGSIPAATLWWDGLTIATNQSDEAAETAFRVMMEAVDAEMVRANNEKAVWLDPAYNPTPASAGVFATRRGRGSPLPDAALHGAAAHRVRLQPRRLPPGQGIGGADPSRTSTRGLYRGGERNRASCNDGASLTRGSGPAIRNRGRRRRHFLLLRPPRSHGFL